MRKFCLCWGVTFLLTLASVLPGTAAITVDAAPPLKLSKAVVDVAVTQDGSRVFVLLKGGEVQMLTAGGSLLERFQLQADAERLVVGPDGSQLYVIAGQQLNVVEVALVHELPVLNSPARGPEKAAVTLTVFSDFQCPYCSRLVAFIDEIQAKNPTTVRVVFKQFPLRMHNMALPAALASLAAREQGKFWPMHDQLFANFNQLSDEKIRTLAKEIGLDLARFDKDRNSQKLRDEVLRDQGLGQQVGVQGTPSVFLNGKLLRERTAQDVQAAIDREVARAKAAR